MLSIIVRKNIEEGMNSQQIADELGIKRNSVHQLIKRHRDKV